ncbi:MAG: hypothetical protein ACI8S6_003336 [Myxococcota bacterium]|jgi:hypothetical protein
MSPALFALLFACSRPAPQSEPARYPWDIELLDDGSTLALGLTPGRSTFTDAIDRFGNSLEVAMFESGEDRSLEIYYSKASLGGLVGRLILILDAPPEVLADIALRSEREPTGAGTGVWRYALPTATEPSLPPLTVKAMTFAPAASLTEETLTARFGPPEQRLTTEDSVILLYPSRGVRITAPARGRELIEYVHPDDFAWLQAHQQTH